MLKWKKESTGYAASDTATSSDFYIGRRRIGFSGRVVFVLYVEGEQYGFDGTLKEKKDAAEYLLEIRRERN